jgi:hypothetical protein
MTVLTFVCRRVAIDYRSNVPGNEEMDLKKQIPSINSMLTRLVYFRQNKLNWSASHILLTLCVVVASVQRATLPESSSGTMCLPCIVYVPFLKFLQRILTDIARHINITKITITIIIKETVRSSVFLNFTQCSSVVCYRRLGTIYWANLQGSSSKEDPWRWDRNVVPKRR